MRTQASALIDKLTDSILEIERLLSISHQEDDYAKLFKVLGGEIEKFLKSFVFPGSTKNFYGLINDLSIYGINKSNINALHDFRTTYNSYKHDPSFSIDIVKAKSIFQKIGVSIDDLTSKNIGQINQAYSQKSKRIVWFAGWDDYIGGLTECNIFLPDYSVDFPIGIEHFNISFEGWDAVIKKFTDSGDLRMGKDNVSSRAYNAWKAQSDFNNAGSFRGDISELVRELTMHTSKREKDLIPFLKRENDAYSVRAAIVFSIFDCLRQDSWTDATNLKDEVLLRSSYDYGINIASLYLNLYIQKVDFQVMVNSRPKLRKTDDILWVDLPSFDKLKDKVISGELNMAFDKINVQIGLLAEQYLQSPQSQMK